VLGLIGAVGLYHVLFTPVADRLIQALPDLNANFPLDRLPFLITLVGVILIVLGNGSKLIRLWQQRQGATIS
jgi:hypothetical protein